MRESDRVLSARILALCEQVAEGAKLPTERQLAAELGVTRSAIRQAMAVLEAEGRVSREVGRGTFLRVPAEGVLAGAAGLSSASLSSAGLSSAGLSSDGRAATDFAPADVMLVRRLLEPQAMPLVVAWATARDFADIDRCLGVGARATAHPEFEKADAALHRSIIAASHSPLLVALYAQVEAARQGKVWGDLKRRSASPERLAEYHGDHVEIVAALKTRDADGAIRAMRSHLARVSRYLLGTDH